MYYIIIKIINQLMPQRTSKKITGTTIFFPDGTKMKFYFKGTVSQKLTIQSPSL